MRKRKRILIVGGSVLALAAAGAGVAVATGGDDGAGQPITGPALEHAKAAALEATGGGQVTETEIRDEEGFYEVEVRRPDGSQVDVHLDRDFSVIDSSADEDGTGADDGAGDD